MSEPKSFATPSEIEAWFAAHHACETELHVRLFKKKSGIASITWDELVEACLCWGWIDGVKRSYDDES